MEAIFILDQKSTQCTRWVATRLEKLVDSPTSIDGIGRKWVPPLQLGSIKPRNLVNIWYECLHRILDRLKAVVNLHRKWVKPFQITFMLGKVIVEVVVFSTQAIQLRGVVSPQVGKLFS